ncbi:unnamed protein product [Ectocarpus sp. CCAP 1310/34]|nr:unnamed protein product [Ectocarpus sp. CCAP 1310/34]
MVVRLRPPDKTGARDKGKRPRRDPTPSSPAPTLPTLPSSPGGTGDDLSRAECIRINDVMPLSRDFRVEGSDAAIEVDGDKAMLLFVAPGVNDDLLRETAPWKDRLNKIIYRVCDFLHEQGTMIVHVPHSYLHHGRRISGQCCLLLFFSCFFSLLTSFHVSMVVVVWVSSLF